MKVLTIDKAKCTGCGSCLNSCSKKAISMINNDGGFLYPSVDKNKCIDCDMCNKKCPLNTKVLSTEPKKIYAAYCKKNDMHLLGSSGNVFGGLANYILENDGIVFGCNMDKNFNILHIAITNKNDLYKIQKSKYVQSNVSESYKTAREYLDCGKKVLFSGTPCQIAGLKTFLKKEYDNLITVDVICHGVPSNSIFKDFINFYQKRKKHKIIKYDFRYKNKKIGNYITHIQTNNGKNYYYPWQGLSFSYLYMNNFIMRDCCYSCKFSNIYRVSDISLGDYWGKKPVENESKNLGISMVLINSQKGINIFNKIKCNYNIVESCKEEVLHSSKSLSQNIIEPKERKELLRKYEINGYSELYKFYRINCKKRNYYNFVLFTKRVIPSKLYKLLRK